MLLQSSARNNVRGRQFVIDGLSWKKKMVSAWAVWGRREEKTFRHCLWNGKKMSVFFSEKRISILGNVCFEEKAISCTWAFVITEAHSSLLFFFYEKRRQSLSEGLCGRKRPFLVNGLRWEENIWACLVQKPISSRFTFGKKRRQSCSMSFCEERRQLPLPNFLSWEAKTIPLQSIMRSQGNFWSIGIMKTIFHQLTFMRSPLTGKGLNRFYC